MNSWKKIASLVAVALAGVTLQAQPARAEEPADVDAEEGIVDEAESALETQPYPYHGGYGRCRSYCDARFRACLRSYGGYGGYYDWRWGYHRGNRWAYARCENRRDDCIQQCRYGGYYRW